LLKRWQRRAGGLIQQQVFRGVGNVIVAADHVSDGHLDVV
jgi:hypothetical protein